MACVHEFGLLAAPDPHRNYETYEPELYGCVAVEDDLLNTLAPAFETLDTCWHTLYRPARGLAWCGITLIPPTSLEQLAEALAHPPADPDGQIAALAALVAQARARQSWIIHFGI